MRARVPGDKLKTVAKLKRTRIVFYGDNITTGANSAIRKPPYAPIWTTLLTARLPPPTISEHVRNQYGGRRDVIVWGVKMPHFARRFNSWLFGIRHERRGKSAVEYAWNINRIIAG